jgi:hypothetical protein
MRSRDGCTAAGADDDRGRVGCPLVCCLLFVFGTTYVWPGSQHRGPGVEFHVEQWILRFIEMNLCADILFV